MPNGVDYLIDVNRRHSEIFSDSGESLARRLYRKLHPIMYIALKCMDGRLNLSIITGTPLGIIQPFRNIAGRFNLGWPLFGETMLEQVTYAINHGLNCLVFVTYHFSKGDKHRGCRGFNYETEKAIEFTRNLKINFDKDFGKKVVYAVQLGIETDFDALILHGENGNIWDLSDELDTSEIHLISKLKILYPDMPDRIALDFLPLIQGNITHISKIKTDQRPIIDTKHREWVIGVGRGFDWLHENNTAILIGPFDPDLDTAIQTAAGIIKVNLEEGQIPPDSKIVLLTSKPFRDEAGPERHLAARKSRFLMDFAIAAIKDKAPEIIPQMEGLAVTVDTNTRAFDMIERIKITA